MISHTGIWNAIDAIAARNGLSVSALARRAGLDPTTFNKSKRTGPGGRLRWPSTESIAKVLAVTGTSAEDLAVLIVETPPVGGSKGAAEPPPVPPVDGFVAGPAAARLARSASPLPSAAAVYVVPAAGLPPLYRAGDRLVLDLQAPPAAGDRALVVGAAESVLVGEVTDGGDGPALAIAGDTRIIPLTPDAASFAARIAWVGYEPPADRAEAGRARD